jgi:hypothetical protein
MALGMSDGEVERGMKGRKMVDGTRKTEPNQTSAGQGGGCGRWTPVPVLGIFGGGVGPLGRLVSFEGGGAR